MHARYYTFNLGRFISVDPVGGEIGSSQSWNRYAYVRGNPVLNVDAYGERIAIANGKYSSTIRKILVQLVMRPSGRAELWQLARDPGFTVTYGNAQYLSRAQIKSLMRSHRKAQFGNTQPIYSRTGEKGRRWAGANVSLDLRAIKSLAPDPSGVTTMAHENYHVQDFRHQKSREEVLEGDDSSKGTSPAEKHGQAIAQEDTDMTEEEAGEILDQMLTAGSDHPDGPGGG